MSLSDGGTITIPPTPTIWDKNGNEIFNNNTGNVGIGTSSPDNKFMVSTLQGVGDAAEDQATGLGVNGF